MRNAIAEIQTKQMQNLPLTAKELKKLEKWKWSLEGLAHSARAHAGNIINRMDGTTLKDMFKFAMLSALAYQSYAVFDGKNNGPVVALVGPIGLELALTPSSGFPLSQAAGLAILAALGVTSYGGISDMSRYWNISQTAANAGQPIPPPPPRVNPLTGELITGLTTPDIYNVIYDISSHQEAINSLIASLTTRQTTKPRLVR